MLNNRRRLRIGGDTALFIREFRVQVCVFHSCTYTHTRSWVVRKSVCQCYHYLLSAQIVRYAATLCLLSTHTHTHTHQIDELPIIRPSTYVMSHLLCMFGMCVFRICQ